MLLIKRAKAPIRLMLSAVALSCWVFSAHAQNNPVAESASYASLKSIFDAAWQRQPEARALQARRDAAQAQAKAAHLLSPEAPTLEVRQRTDQMTGNYGAREAEVGLAIPLWLPGQRTASAELAQAEVSFVERKLLASQLRLAATVREAWWGWQRARVDADLASEQLINARRLAADVAKRVQAGDLARSDQHQVAAQAQAASSAALSQLVALTGSTSAPATSSGTGNEPTPSSSQSISHPLLAELEDRIAIAERTANLISTQKRANPELTVATTRDRGAFGERYGQTVQVGIRLPFGAGPRYDARIATAQAEAIEVQSQLTLEKDRIQADQRAAAARVEASRIQLNAAQRRAQLARESRGFFDKSFKLG
ncbi:MAG: transporter, partial [Betaproteobacteria bacterium]|nr:transporter [Betaproteobacteria bacterium]